MTQVQNNQYNNQYNNDQVLTLADEVINECDSIFSTNDSIESITHQLNLLDEYIDIRVDNYSKLLRAMPHITDEHTSNIVNEFFVTKVKEDIEEAKNILVNAKALVDDSYELCFDYLIEEADSLTEDAASAESICIEDGIEEEKLTYTDVLDELVKKSNVIDSVDNKLNDLDEYRIDIQDRVVEEDLEKVNGFIYELIYAIIKEKGDMTYTDFNLFIQNELAHNPDVTADQFIEYLYNCREEAPNCIVAEDLSKVKRQINVAIYNNELLLNH